MASSRTRKVPVTGTRQTGTQVHASLTINRSRAEKPVPNGTDPSPYDLLTIDKLQALSKERSMKGFWKLRKPDLVELHKQYDTDHPQQPKNPRRSKPAARPRATEKIEAKAATPKPRPVKGEHNAPPQVTKDDPMSQPKNSALSDADKALAEAQKAAATVVQPPQRVVIDVNVIQPPPQEPVAAPVVAPPPVYAAPPVGGGGDNNNGGGPRATATNNGGSNRSLLGWLAVAATILVGAIIIAYVVANRDDGNNSTPANSGVTTGTNTGANSNSGSGANADAAGINNANQAAMSCPENIRPQCMTVLNDVNAGRKTAAQARDEITSLIAGNKTGGNGQPGNNSGNTLPNGGGANVVVSSNGSGPNLDSVESGDCRLVQKSDTRIYLESGVNRSCTHTLSGLPKDWQMTVDAVEQVVDGVQCVHCVKGYELGESVKITINNGAAILGSPKIASDRFCEIYKTSLENAWVPAENPMPLKGWKTCN